MTWVSISKCAGQIGRWVFPISGLIYVASLFFPWITAPPTSVDASWELALHWAAEHHLQFGKEVVFTFGPWGMLYGGYHPPTHALCASIWVILALIFGWSGWRVARHFSTNLLVAWIWLMLFLGLAGMRGEQSVDIRVTGWALLSLVLYFFVEKSQVSAWQMLMAFAAGILALIKFTCFIQLGVVFLLIGMDVLLQRRRFPWIWVTYAGSVLFFWLAAGQSLAQLGSYLRYSVMVSGGYTPAMMLSGESENMDLVGMLLSITALVTVIGALAWRQERFYALLPLAGFSGVLFLVFKLGYVRYHPIHGITTTLQLMLATLICLAVAWPVLKSQRWWIPGMVCGALTGIYLFGAFTFARCYREQGYPGERLWVNYAWTLNGHNLTAPTRLLHDPQYLEKIHLQNLNAIRETFPLPSLQGSVDVYPWRQAVIFAHGLTYDPRPILQSYSAYTPELARLNASHLRGAQAPDNVLFDIDPQNHNYPSIEDGPSWLELLSRYDMAETTPGFVILKKAAQPRKYQLTPVTNLLRTIGNPVNVPTGQGPTWVEIEVRPSLRGALASIFYKPRRLLLVVVLQNGEQRVFNLVPGMAKAGFLLSPLISDKTSFVSLANGNSTHDLDKLQIASAAVVSDGSTGPNPDYQPLIRWQFYRLDFTPWKLE